MHLLLPHVLTQASLWWTQVPFNNSLVTSEALSNPALPFYFCIAAANASETCELLHIVVSRAGHTCQHVTCRGSSMQGSL